MKIKKVAIIGVGLIGGSIGLALRENYPDLKVIGIPRREETIIEALNRGAVTEGTLDKKEGVKGADIIFVATPVQTVRSVVEEIYPYVKDKAIITDVGSTKSEIVSKIESFIPENINFIGGHPLAGSERTGIEAASPTLFKNTSYMLTPTKKTDSGAFKTLHKLLTSIGANIVAMEPERHDKVTAYISHLPHLLASSLVQMTGEQSEDVENLLSFTAGGFRDMTRIAAGSPSIWVDIFLSNAGALSKVVDEYRDVLLKIKDAIKSKDKEVLNEFLEGARKKRLNLPVRAEKKLEFLRDILIPVKDKPGALSEVTVAFGRLGINIEDIEIIHGDGQGLLKITISGEEKSKKAIKELEKMGFEPKVKKTYDKE
ncbi:MAG: prephenate dehydrogenase [Actinomycetia bacterium]|nr:prephenate dehydrogenase [Actinomycetes bacterium]